CFDGVLPSFPTRRSSDLNLVDTGGMLGDEGVLTDLMDEQIMQAVEEADLLLFVVSAKEGLMPDDLRILERIRPFAKTTWLIVNRSEEHTSELQSRENLVC